MLAKVRCPLPLSKNERPEFNSFDTLSGRSDGPLVSGEKYELAIIRRYDFEAALQRMSVVVRNMADHTFRAYVKGSPEKIADLCNPETLPPDYLETLETYTRKGYRVIALAYKHLEKTSFL